MSLRSIFPENSECAPEDAELLRRWITERYLPEENNWLRINLIQSLNGETVGADATSDTLSNPLDRIILHVIRSQADAVLVGARSIRQENFSPAAGSTMVVLTGSGDLSSHHIQVRGNPGSPVRLVALGPAAAAARFQATAAAAFPAELGVEAEFFALPGSTGAIKPSALAESIVLALRSLSLKKVVCEGGGYLAGMLIENGVVDELCLTVAPLLKGPEHTQIQLSPRLWRQLTPRRLLLDGCGNIYGRWHIGAP